MMKSKFDAVVIGVSAGGGKALRTILPALEIPFSLSVIVVQHLWRSSDNYLPLSLNKLCQLSVKEADEKERLQAGTIYVAPANYHLVVEKNKTLSLSVDIPVNHSRPSIDVLFESAAEVFGSRLIGVILTGANDDGSQGLKAIKEAGGITIVQDPSTAEVDIMPQAALDCVEVDYVLTLEEMGTFLMEFSEHSSEHSY